MKWELKLGSANYVIDSETGKKVCEFPGYVSSAHPECLLVLAAPDLLTACQEALELIRHTTGNSGITISAGTFGVQLENILKDAIAKATQPS